METAIALVEKSKPTLIQLVLANLPRGASIEEAERLVIKEIGNLQMIMSIKPELLSCDPMSVMLVVKQCISDNLTLAPNSALVYLFPGKVCIGTVNNQKQYKEVLNYDPTANGRLSIARQAGRILDNKRPAFTYDDSGAVDTVTVEFLVPSYPSPRWEVITFGKPYFEKWKQKSAAKFGGSANGNYTSFNKGIDPEFAGSKAIRHGLNKLGTNMNERNRNMAVAMDFKAEPITSVVKESSEENAVEDAIATVVNEDIDPTELC